MYAAAERSVTWISTVLPPIDIASWIPAFKSEREYLLHPTRKIVAKACGKISHSEPGYVPQGAGLSAMSDRLSVEQKRRIKL